MVLKTRLGEIPSGIQQAVDEISVLSNLDELLKFALTVNSKAKDNNLTHRRVFF
jgi:hypothetical protein